MTNLDSADTLLRNRGAALAFVRPPALLHTKQSEEDAVMSSATRHSVEESLVGFINALMTKTQERRIVWKRSASLITTTIEDGLIVEFASSFSQGSEFWNSFTVYDAEGNELLRATPLSSTYAKRPFAAPLESLFRAATQSSGHG